MAEYYIHQETNGVTSYKKVDGEKVIIAGFEDESFFIHHIRDNNDMGYRITEANTGVFLFGTYKTKDLAIKDVTDKLTKVGLIKFNEALVKNINEHHTPYYDNLHKTQTLMDKTIILPDDIYEAINQRILKNHMDYKEYVCKILRNELTRKHHKLVDK